MLTPTTRALYLVLWLGVPTLSGLALSGWMRSRHSLPLWRRRVGFVSIIATFIGFFIPLALAVVYATRLHLPFDEDRLLEATFGVAVAGIVHGCALKGMPRIQVLLANIMLIAMLRLSMIE